jgi:hypothetical protein
MKRRNTIVVSVILLAGCIAPIKQFYPGTYFPEDRIYENKPIGFSMSYRGNWELITDPNRMKDNTKFARELHQTGAELLFIGFTVERTQGTRFIANNLNETNREYAEQIQNINKTQVDSDSGLADDTVHSIPVVRWEYSKSDFKFVEYFFSVDTYNLRVAFWTKPSLYANFFPIYKEIMESLTLTNSY